MFEIPEAAPTSSAGTADVDAADAGPFANARPIESTTSGATKAAKVQLDCTNASAAKLTAESRKPNAIRRAGPSLTASGVISGVARIIMAAAGSVARPASSALIPNAAGSWKYRLSTYIRALIVPATIRIASVAPTSWTLRSSLRSTSGASTRFSTARNSTMDTIEIAKHPSVAADAQPQSLPSLSAGISGTRMAAINTVPTQSIEEERFGSRDSLTVKIVRGMQTAAMPASIQNSPCQPVVSTRTPPSS